MAESAEKTFFLFFSSLRLRVSAVNIVLPVWSYAQDAVIGILRQRGGLGPGQPA